MSTMFLVTGTLFPLYKIFRLQASYKLHRMSSKCEIYKCFSTFFLVVTKWGILQECTSIHTCLFFILPGFINFISQVWELRHYKASVPKLSHNYSALQYNIKDNETGKF